MPIPNKVRKMLQSLNEEFIGQKNTQAVRDMFVARVTEICRENCMPAGHGFKFTTTIDMDRNTIMTVGHVYRTRKQMNEEMVEVTSDKVKTEVDTETIRYILEGYTGL